MNYIPLNRLLAACLFVTSLSLGWLDAGHRNLAPYVYGVGLGIASGAVALLFFAHLGKLYGNRELGRIQGSSMLSCLHQLGPRHFLGNKRATTSYTSVLYRACYFHVRDGIVAMFTALPRQNTDLASTSTQRKTLYGHQHGATNCNPHRSLSYITECD